MNLTQVIFTSAIVSLLMLVASLGFFSYATASGASPVPGMMHGGFKRMHMGNGHDRKREHLKSFCNEGGKQKIEHMVSYVEDRFEFTAAQSQEWNKVVNALHSEENTISVICDKVLTKENHATIPARMELMETVALTGIEAMQRIRPFVEAFYASLDDKQKRTLDDLLAHRKHKRHI